MFDGLLPASDEYWWEEFYLDVKVNGDFNSEYEYADIYIESNLIGTVGNFSSCRCLTTALTIVSFSCP